MGRDIRLAVRLLAKDRAFTAAAVLALSLGIAANSTVFTLVNGLVLRDLPFPEPDRLVAIETISTGTPRRQSSNLSYLDLRDLQASARVFDGIAGVDQTAMNVAGDTSPAERVIGSYVSANTFALLGARPVLGRDFQPADDRVGAEPAAILGYAFWQNRYRGDPGIVGRTLRVNGVTATVIGVMPDGFAFPDVAHIWQPLAMRTDPDMERRDGRSLDAFGRLARGVTLQQGAADLEIAMAGLAALHPETNAGVVPRVTSYRDALVGGSIVEVFSAFVGAVGFLLLIACANVANLVLVRGAKRAREVSVRMSLGATRHQIVRQLLVESLVLAAVAGVIGIGVGAIGARLFATSLSGIATTYWLQFPLDGRVFAFVAAMCLGTAVLCGLAPALHTSKVGILGLLGESGRGATASPRQRRWAGSLVVAQLSLTFVLLVGAGLLVRNVTAQYAIDAGIDTAGLITMRVELPAGAYATPQQRDLFYRQLDERLDTLPGMRAAVASWAPLMGASLRNVSIEGRSGTESGQRRPSMIAIGPRYFDVIGIQPLRGRVLDASDGIAQPAAVVNERFVAQHFTGEDPIGRRIRLESRTAGDSTAWLTIVGVVPNVHQEDSDPRFFEPVVYVPYAMERLPAATIIVRSPLDVAAVAAALRREVRGLDADLPLFNVASLDDDFAATFSLMRVAGSTLGFFAIAALILAAVGLYAVTAYAVSQRTREIGVRVALGATRGTVWWLVTRRVAAHLGIGLVLGVAGAAGATQAIEGLLAGVSSRDPLTFVTVTSLLVVVALVACVAPARRAMRLNPVAALRSE